MGMVHVWNEAWVMMVIAVVNRVASKCPQACKSQQMKVSKVCSEMCLRTRRATTPQETTSSNETLQPERMVINHDVCTSGSYTGICTNSSTKLDCLLLILNVVLTRLSAF